MKDQENRTFSHSATETFSEAGLAFHRMKFLPKINRIKTYFGDTKIQLLDIGVGYGNFLLLCKQELKNAELSGLDPYQRSIEITKELTKIEVAKGKIEDEQWPFNFKFDVITCFDVIEHLEEPKFFLLHARKYLKPRGIIVFSTPLKELPYRLRSIPFIGIPDTNPTHINVHPPRYWKKLIEENNYEIIETWKGEYLTHIKWFSSALEKICRVLGINHRKLPLINSMEQSVHYIIKPSSNVA